MMQIVRRELAQARLILDPQDRLRRDARRGPPPPPPEAPPEEHADHHRRWAARAPGPRPRPPGRLALELTHALGDDGTRAPLRSRLRLVTTENPQGFLLFFDRVRVRDDESKRLSGLAEGRYELLVTSPYLAPLRTPVTLGGADGVAGATLLLLEPGPAYPFDQLAGDPPAQIEGRLTTADGAVPSAATLALLRLELRPPDPPANDRLLGPPVQPDGNGRFLLLVEPPAAGRFRLHLIDGDGAVHPLATGDLPPPGARLGLDASPLPLA